MGLELGADDYLAKPFEPRELALRITNILKHARPQRTAPLQSVRFGPFVFHMASGELRRGEEAIRLTERECEMLRVLATNAGETVPRQALAGKQYGLPVAASVRALFYNKDIFARAGIAAPPATWDDLIADAKRVKALNEPNLFGFGMQGKGFARLNIGTTGALLEEAVRRMGRSTV